MGRYPHLKPEGPTAAAPPSASLLTTQTPLAGGAARPASCKHADIDVENFAAENGDGQATVCVVTFSGNPASPKQTMVQANLAAACAANSQALLHAQVLLHAPAQPLGAEAEGVATCTETPRLSRHPVLTVKATQARPAATGETPSLIPAASSCPAADADDVGDVIIMDAFLRNLKAEDSAIDEDPTADEDLGVVVPADASADATVLAALDTTSAQAISPIDEDCALGHSTQNRPFASFVAIEVLELSHFTYIAGCISPQPQLPATLLKVNSFSCDNAATLFAHGAATSFDVGLHANTADRMVHANHPLRAPAVGTINQANHRSALDVAKSARASVTDATVLPQLPAHATLAPIAMSGVPFNRYIGANLLTQTPNLLLCQGAISTSNNDQAFKVPSKSLLPWIPINFDPGGEPFHDETPTEEVLHLCPRSHLLWFSFLLIDEVVEYTVCVSTVAIKKMTINDHLFPGHFLELPLMLDVATSNIENFDHVISMIANSTLKDPLDVNISFRVEGQVPCASNIEDQEDKNTEFFVLNTGEDMEIIIKKSEPPQEIGDASVEASCDASCVGGAIGASSAGADMENISEKSEPPQDNGDASVDASGDVICAGGASGVGEDTIEPPQENGNASVDSSGDASCGGGAGGAGEYMEIIIEKSEPPQENGDPSVDAGADASCAGGAVGASATKYVRHDDGTVPHPWEDGGDARGVASYVRNNDGTVSHPWEDPKNILFESKPAIILDINGVLMTLVGKRYRS
ncbi:hypothetical protein L7F22_064743 [Adiantum nelumboides]|nr:hypothetical protein [Adiantum nelumboides]